MSGHTSSVALGRGIDIQGYLSRNDSYSFFKRLNVRERLDAEVGDLVISGPTGTNVMDIQCILVKSRDLNNVDV